MRRITISLLFILVCLTWGTTWLAMKIAVDTIPPVFATGMRFIAASPLLIIMAWLTRAPLLLAIYALNVVHRTSLGITRAGDAYSSAIKS